MVLVALLVGFPAKADDLVLKDGKTIEWRILKDNGDTVDVQTADNKTITIKKQDIKEIRTSIPAAPLTGATFLGDTTKPADKPTNVLAMIDPKKHGTAGTWKVAAGALMGSGDALCDIPYIPTAYYDVEITLERRDGEDECTIGLVGNGKPFGVNLDWGKGACSGLSAIDGRRVYENEAKVDGKFFTNRKPRTIVCAVRADQIVVLADGKEFIRWKGDPKHLSHPNRPEKNQNLFFLVHQSTYVISKLVVTPRKSTE